MKLMRPRYVLLLVGSLGFSLAALAQTPTRTKPPAPSTNTPPAVVAPVEIPKSVFTAPKSPKEGRNPFFPDSRQVTEQVKSTPAQAPVLLVLNGISSPPKATAMINGSTFEVGEQSSVRLADGRRISIKCMEIREFSVVITIGSEQRELKLRPGL